MRKGKNKSVHSHLHSSSWNVSMKKKKFFRIMLPGFRTQLDLPHQFCKSAIEEFSPNGEIRTCLGNWKIKVGKLKSEEIFYFHGAGWKRFVEKHDLHECDCVVFAHHGSFRFHATIFMPSGCLKELSPNTNVDHENLPRHESLNHTFTRILSAHSGGDFHNRPTSRLYLPTKIWKYNDNFLGKKKAILRFSGLYTMEWEANLTYYPGENYDRFAVAEGWYDFVCANEIKKGCYCKFEIVVDASPLGYSKKEIIIIVTKLN